MHSIVLLAVAGPDYECICADVGTNGGMVYRTDVACPKQLKMVISA